MTEQKVVSFDNPLVAEWPTEGVVSFENYSTRYREGLDLALQGISFKTKPAEKVGFLHFL